MPQETKGFISANEKSLVALQFFKTENMSTLGDTCKLPLLALIPALEADSPAEDRSFPAPSEHTHTQNQTFAITLSVFDVV